MVPPILDGPWDAALDQQAAYEALTEEHEIWAMEQEVPILEDSPRTCSSRGYAKSSITSHGASFSTHPTTQDMDHLSIMLQRLDSQDI